MQHWVHMAKRKAVHRVHHRAHSRQGRTSEQYLVVVRGWMLVVAFALMLGVGGVVGNYINKQLDQATPTVAGVTTDR